MLQVWSQKRSVWQTSKWQNLESKKKYVSIFHLLQNMEDFILPQILHYSFLHAFYETIHQRDISYLYV